MDKSLIKGTLRRVALTGGSQEDFATLRNELGHASFQVTHELRLVKLGCSDETVVDRIAAVASL